MDIRRLGIVGGIAVSWACICSFIAYGSSDLYSLIYLWLTSFHVFFSLPINRLLSTKRNELNSTEGKIEYLAMVQRFRAAKIAIISLKQNRMKK
jgi:hypothetical protein